MGGLPIVKDVVKAAGLGPSTDGQVTPTTPTTTEDTPKIDVRKFRRSSRRSTRIGRSLIGGALADFDRTGTDYSPVRNPRGSSTLGG